MPHNDYLLRHIHKHHDPFVRDLFKELDTRINEMETGNEDVFVERMKVSDAWIAIITTIAIIIFFATSITAHM